MLRRRSFARAPRSPPRRFVFVRGVPAVGPPFAAVSARPSRRAVVRLVAALCARPNRRADVCRPLHPGLVTPACSSALYVSLRRVRRPPKPLRRQPLGRRALPLVPAATPRLDDHRPARAPTSSSSSVCTTPPDVVPSRSPSAFAGFASVFLPPSRYRVESMLCRWSRGYSCRRCFSFAEKLQTSVIVRQRIK